MEHNILVRTGVGQIRRMAREALRGHWASAYAGFLLYAALVVIPLTILGGVLGGFDAAPSVLGVFDAAPNARIAHSQSALTAFSEAMPLPNLTDLYLLIIAGPMQLGIVTFCLALFRRRDHDASLVLFGFNRFGKAFGLFLLMFLFLCLWSLLFVIPAIIASYAYAMAFFLLADDRGIGLREAVRTSRRMMIGNKGKLFCLRLSFLGWLFLSVLVFSVLMNLLRSYGLLSWLGSGFPEALVYNILLCLLTAPAMAYMGVAETAFYELASGKRRPGTIEGRFTVDDDGTFYREDAASWRAGTGPLAPPEDAPPEHALPEREEDRRTDGPEENGQ
jgi:uncharacterized membrane protein